MMGERFGRYETIRTIASGGMATVHLARAIGEGGFERLFAVKVMHPHIAADPDFQSMFLDEARLAARIRHPNVVATIDVLKADAGMFLVMEYVDGPSLHVLRREFRRQKKVMPIEHTLRIFVDVLSGLHAAHELTGAGGEALQLIHRDVSPQNILVGRDGVTRITDFGVARAEARITSTRGGQLKGKLAYMPPEQARNEPIDRRVDIYAAAISLWETLTGKRLFSADSEAGLIHMILEGATKSPRDANPNVPELISAVCMKGLAADRKERFATAAELADALEEAAQASGTTISTSRKLATFIATLPARFSERPAAMTTTPSARSLRLPTGEASTRAVGDGPSPFDGSGPDRPSSRAEGERAPSSVTTASAVITAPARARGSRRTLWLGAAAATLILGGMAFVLTTRAPDTASPTAAAPEPATPLTTTVAADRGATPPAATAAPEPPPSARTTSEPSKQPAAVTPEPAISDVAPKVRGSPTPLTSASSGRATRGVPGTPPAKSDPGHRGPGYRPKEL